MLKLETHLGHKKEILKIVRQEMERLDKGYDVHWTALCRIRELALRK